MQLKKLFNNLLKVFNIIFLGLNLNINLSISEAKIITNSSSNSSSSSNAVSKNSSTSAFGVLNKKSRNIDGNYIKINSLRIWRSPEGTRIVFDLSNKINYTVQKLVDPHRIVIDIKQARLSDKLIADLNKTFSANIRDINISKDINANINNNNINNIKKIKTNFNLNSKILRIVLELDRQIDINSFLLEPNERYGHRLVLDLECLEYIAKEKQRILALFDLDLKGQPYKSNVNLNANNIQFNNITVNNIQTNNIHTNNVQVNNIKPDINSKLNSNFNSRNGVNHKLLIAIDPGHGGEDPGAIGPRGTLEKDIVLSIAKILKERINQRSNMQAFLIRNGDYYVSLYNRMLRARLNRADLFLSIHADAYSNPKADGGSVFILSERGASSAAARWLADTQNRSDTIGGVRIANKRDPLASVLLDLSQTANYTTSMQVAKSILLSMQNTVTLHKHQVEHANFAVLKAPDVPSVLIETGFISNPKTEFKLKNYYYQKKIVDSIVKGVDNYFALQAKNNLLKTKK